MTARAASLAHAPRAALTVSRAVGVLVVLGVLLTPVLNAGEVYALVAGLVRAQEEAYTPLYVKALKDLCFAVLGLVSLVGLILRGRASVLVFPFLVFALFVAASAVQVYAVDPRLALAGLRWVFPVVLCFLLVGHVDAALLARLARVTALLLVVHFVAQLFELFFMSNWFGSNLFGLAGRVPGMFFIPNTASFFTVVTLFLAHFHGARHWERTLVHGIAPASIFLTQSGTGLVVYALFLVIVTVGRYGVRRAAPLLVLAPVLAAALLPLLAGLTGRGADYVAVSGGIRLEVLARVLAAGDAFPRLFGHATNTAVGFAANLGLPGERALAVIADSTYTSIIGNLGFIGLAGFVVGALVWGLYLLYTPSLELYLFTVVFGLYGATTVVTEAYPMSLIFAVLMAYYARRSLVPFLVRLLTVPATPITIRGTP